MGSFAKLNPLFKIVKKPAGAQISTQGHCLRAVSVPYTDSQDTPETYYPPRPIEIPVHRKPSKAVVVMPGKGTSGSAYFPEVLFFPGVFQKTGFFYVRKGRRKKDNCFGLIKTLTRKVPKYDNMAKATHKRLCNFSGITFSIHPGCFKLNRRLVMLGLSWGVFFAYIIGLATVVVSIIHPFIASSESWDIEKIED